MATSGENTDESESEVQSCQCETCKRTHIGRMLRELAGIRENVESAISDALKELYELLFLKPAGAEQYKEKILNFRIHYFPDRSMHYSGRITLLKYMGKLRTKRIGRILNFEDWNTSGHERLSLDIVNFLRSGEYPGEDTDESESEMQSFESETCKRTHIGRMLRELAGIRENVESAISVDLKELYDLLFLKPPSAEQYKEKILNFRIHYFPDRSMHYSGRITLLKYIGYIATKRIGRILNFEDWNTSGHERLSLDIVNFLRSGEYPGKEIRSEDGHICLIEVEDSPMEPEDYAALDVKKLGFPVKLFKSFTTNLAVEIIRRNRVHVAEYLRRNTEFQTMLNGFSTEFLQTVVNNFEEEFNDVYNTMEKKLFVIFDETYLYSLSIDCDQKLAKKCELMVEREKGNLLENLHSIISAWFQEIVRNFLTHIRTNIGAAVGDSFCTIARESLKKYKSQYFEKEQNDLLRYIRLNLTLIFLETFEEGYFIEFNRQWGLLMRKIFNYTLKTTIADTRSIRHIRELYLREMLEEKVQKKFDTLFEYFELRNDDFFMYLREV